MDEEDARELARDIIAPCGLLGHLIGRGSWWPSDTARRNGKRAVGRVMGSSYHFLRPLWRLHPSLDPGKANDPFGLASGATPLSDTPEDLSLLLQQVETAVRRALPLLEAGIPDGRDHFNSAAQEVFEATEEAARLFKEVARP